MPPLPLAIAPARLERATLERAENLPSGGAYRPGDVLTSLDGSPVEVIDTDAEGWLVLADALAYAARQTSPRPVDALVDLATLTGSIVSALGNEAAGLPNGRRTTPSRALPGPGCGPYYVFWNLLICRDRLG
jgi:leucyl aminopeptidase